MVQKRGQTTSGSHRDADATAEASTEGNAGRKAHSARIERLFREHNDSLIRFVFARLHSESEAHEIVQEAYVRLLKLDEPDAVSYLRAFMYRTAANLVQDRLKQRQRRNELRQLLVFEAPEPRPEVDLAVDADEALAIIRRAIREMPPKCQTAFLLHRVHDVPVAEVAQRMSLSVRMVRLYIARALAHCRERLDGLQ